MNIFSRIRGALTGRNTPEIPRTQTILPIPKDGIRKVFEGVLISMKTKDYYDRLLDDGSTYEETRMTVKTDEGWTINGRVPGMHRGATPVHLQPEIGKRVVFKANVRRSPEDPLFGFFEYAYFSVTNNSRRIAMSKRYSLTHRARMNRTRYFASVRVKKRVEIADRRRVTSNARSTTGRKLRKWPQKQDSVLTLPMTYTTV